MSDSRIYTTKDYSKFRLLPSNRPVTDATIRAKIRELKRKNLLRDFPILVKKSGSFFDIYDGQNRFEAARALKLPIFYKVSQVITVEDVAHVNSAQTKWKPSDYLSHGCALGNAHYDALAEFIADTGVPLSVAIGLVGGIECYGKVSAAFKAGRFEAKDNTHARKVAEVLNIFRQYIKWATDRSFVLAISRILRATKLDTKRLALKVSSHVSQLVKCANWLQYVEIIDRLYNFKVRGDEIVSIREDVRKWVAKHQADSAKAASK